MPKDEWGTKRVCPTTGKRFYDMNRTPIVSPYSGEVVTVDAGRSRTMVADAEDAQTKKLAEKKKVEEKDDLLTGDSDDDDSDDVDLGDEVLQDDDDDDDTVSFNELGDVAANDEE